MADFWYTNALRAVLAGEIDLDTGGDDIRVILCMSNTTADTEEDVTTVSGFTTLDEYDGGARPPAFGSRDALASEAVSADNTNDRGKFDAADLTLTSVDAGTRANASLVIYKHGTSDADSVPLIHLDCSFSGNGGNITLQFNTNGIGYLQG